MLPKLAKAGQHNGARSFRTTGANLMTILVAGMGSFMFGYSTNAITGSLAQVSFNVYFLSNGNADSVIGGILGGFLGGAFLGALLQGWVSTKYGRRVATASAAVLIIVAGALMAGSVHIAMFIVARIISGLGAGILTSNTPVYMSEISPAATRGLLTSVHGVGITTAYIFSSVLALAFNFIDHPYQWRLQFIVYTFCAILLLVSLHFIPESPRWLMEQERYDEARVVLERLHGTGDGNDVNIAHAEMAQIRAQLDSERTMPTGYIHIFKTPSLRKRAICSIVVWIMNIGTGILVIATLTPLLFKALGLSVTLQLGLAVVWVVCATIGATINGFLLDRFGRRPLFIIGGYTVSCILLIQALLEKYYLDSNYEPGLKAATAMFFIFVLFWGSLLDNTTYVYVPEIWPTHLRSQGSAIAFMSYYGVAIATTAPASLAFASIGYKYYFVFMALCIVGTTYIAFVFPETAGLTLEEIGAKFGDVVQLDFDEAVARADHVDTEKVNSKMVEIAIENES